MIVGKVEGFELLDQFWSKIVEEVGKEFFVFNVVCLMVWLNLRVIGFLVVVVVLIVCVWFFVNSEFFNCVDDFLMEIQVFFGSVVLMIDDCFVVIVLELFQVDECYFDEMCFLMCQFDMECYVECLMSELWCVSEGFFFFGDDFDLFDFDGLGVDVSVQFWQ